MSILTNSTHSAGPATDGYSLRADLASIDTEEPGWHAWVDDAGRCHGTHCYTRAEMTVIEAALTERERATGCHAATGICLDAWTPDSIRKQIAEHRHAWEVAIRNAGVAA